MINIYSLLKTNSLEKNIFLAISISNNGKDLIHIMSEIYARVLRLKSGNENISRVDAEYYNIEEMKSLVKECYDIDLTALAEFYQRAKDLEISKKQYQINNYSEKRADFLNIYALRHEQKMDDQVITNQYINYIKINFDIG